MPIDRMMFRKIGRILRDEQNSTNNDRIISMVYKIRPTPYENHTLQYCAKRRISSFSACFLTVALTCV
ncbi:MAG: hypothetical protein OXC62_00965, partial [Aestuariivita sp.]|nr:hypothetical protein [Aestuariivita sp.]